MKIEERIGKYLNEEDSSQKFKKGSYVKMTKKTNKGVMNYNGIVWGTYSQLYGGNNTKEYSVIILDDNENSTNQVSWYNEDELQLLSKDITKGIKIINDFRKNFEKKYNRSI